MDAHSLECLDFARVRALVADCALTDLGRTLAAKIRPAARPELVRRWLNQIEEVQRLEAERGTPPFAGLSDVRDIVRRSAPPLSLSVEEVARVGQALSGTHAVAEYLRELPEDCPEVRHLAGRIGDFRTIAERIQALIDERGQVRDDASDKLRRVRREIEAAAAQISDTVERLLRSSDVRRLLQYSNHTFHSDRLVLPMRAEYRGRLPGIVHRTSDSGATIYVEPAEVVELNNRISNFRSEEAEEIARLVWEVTHEVYLNSKAIIKTLDTLAVLDLIVAKVRLARQFDMRCPKLNEQGVLDVRQARHPLLLDLAHRKRQSGEEPAPVVPIDFRLGDDFTLLLITGPNTGGKTVTLKTVGLLCLMVQAGLPVPVAPGSSMGLFKDVLIDVGDEQSMQQSLSTFSGHLKRILETLRLSGPQSLVLLDELGAGTDPDEGAAIGRAVLDELLRLQCRCIVTTHLGVLKGYALTREKAENACVEFDTETLRPTFHLRIGESGSSNAIEIARRLGMPRRLVQNARRNLSRKARAMRAALEGTAVVKRQAENARKEAESAQRRADRAQHDADQARTHYEQQQTDFQEWVCRVVHLQPGDAVRVRNFDRDGRVVRMRLDLHRAEVDVGAFAVEVPLGDVLPPATPPPPPPPPRPAAPGAASPSHRPEPRAPHRQRAARGERGSDKRPEGRSQRPEHPPRPVLPALTDDQAAALRPGDTVYAKRFHREGTVVRIKLARKMAVVTVGVLEIEAPFDGLALPPQHQEKPPRPPRKNPPVAAQPRMAAQQPEQPGPTPTAPQEPPAAPPDSPTT
ncbi:MAG: DNA strand exchange inhibitor protein [Planctomycetes bacterium]|nr:DNA strand exchange inhibitor protein [Planctomycetota bacterium]